MSQALVNYYLSLCRKGDPPHPGSPCAALAWQAAEIERLQAELGELRRQLDELEGERE